MFEENKAINKLKTGFAHLSVPRSPLPEILSPYPASSFPLKFLCPLLGLEGGWRTSDPASLLKTNLVVTVQCTVHVLLVFWGFDLRF